MSKIEVEVFTHLLTAFAQGAGAGPAKQILLVLDRAGWQTSPQVPVPAGVQFHFLPPYSPELQPAERLWPLTNEPVINRHFQDLVELEEVQAHRCRVLAEQQDLVRSHTSLPQQRNGRGPFLSLVAENGLNRHGYLSQFDMTSLGAALVAGGSATAGSSPRCQYPHEALYGAECERGVSRLCHAGGLENRGSRSKRELATVLDRFTHPSACCRPSMLDRARAQ